MYYVAEGHPPRPAWRAGLRWSFFGATPRGTWSRSRCCGWRRPTCASSSARSRRSGRRSRRVRARGGGRAAAPLHLYGVTTWGLAGSGGFRDGDGQGPPGELTERVCLRVCGGAAKSLYRPPRPGETIFKVGKAAVAAREEQADSRGLGWAVPPPPVQGLICAPGSPDRPAGPPQLRPHAAAAARHHVQHRAGGAGESMIHAMSCHASLYPCILHAPQPWRSAVSGLVSRSWVPSSHAPAPPLPPAAPQGGPSTALQPADFAAEIVQHFPEGAVTAPYKWKDYAPRVFRQLRRVAGLDSRDYLLSLTGGGALRELPSPGKSGSVFFLSDDDRWAGRTGGIGAGGPGGLGLSARTWEGWEGGRASVGRWAKGHSRVLPLLHNGGR